jgi:hypothetical protein
MIRRLRQHQDLRHLLHPLWSMQSQYKLMIRSQRQRQQSMQIHLQRPHRHQYQLQHFYGRRFTFRRMLLHERQEAKMVAIPQFPKQTRSLKSRMAPKLLALKITLWRIRRQVCPLAQLLSRRYLLLTARALLRLMMSLLIRRHLPSLSTCLLSKLHRLLLLVLRLVTLGTLVLR